MHQPTHPHPDVVRPNHNRSDTLPEPQVQKPNRKEPARTPKPAAKKRMPLHHLNLLHLFLRHSPSPNPSTLSRAAPADPVQLVVVNVGNADRNEGQKNAK